MPDLSLEDVLADDLLPAACDVASGRWWETAASSFLRSLRARGFDIVADTPLGDAPATVGWRHDDDGEAWVLPATDGTEVARLADAWLGSVPGAAAMLGIPDGRAKPDEPLGPALAALAAVGSPAERARAASAMIDTLRDVRAEAAATAWRTRATGGVTEFAVTLGMSRAEMATALGHHPARGET